MKPVDIIAFWGQRKLRRWTPAELQAAKLPAAVQDPLARIGLPIDADWTLRFDYPKLDTIDGNWVRIGSDAGSDICISTRTGEVACREEGEWRFVNSSIDRFIACLTIYQQYRLNVRAMDDTAEDEQLEEVERTREALAVVDADALEDERYWALIVEQMESGQL